MKYQRNFNFILLFDDVDFGAVTQYADIEAGTYDVRVVQENTGAVIYEISDMILNELHTTLVTHGSVSRSDEFPYAITKLIDDNDPSRTQARLRVYHCAAGAPDIDVAIDGDVLFTDLDYTDLSDYRNIASGNHVVGFFNTVNGQVVVSPTTLPFDEETIVNLYFAGSDSSSSDSLTMIVGIDIETGNRDVETTNPASVMKICFSLLVVALVFAF